MLVTKKTLISLLSVVTCSRVAFATDTPPVCNPANSVAAVSTNELKNTTELFCEDLVTYPRITNATIVPPISFGSGSNNKIVGLYGRYQSSIPNIFIWFAVTFSNEDWMGGFKFPTGEASTKKGTCVKQFEDAINGCPAEAHNMSLGAIAKYDARVLMIRLASEDSNPLFDYWGRDLGEFRCNVANTTTTTNYAMPCICSFSGYPGLTDAFKSVGKGCPITLTNATVLGDKLPSVPISKHSQLIRVDKSVPEKYLSP